MIRRIVASGLACLLLILALPLLAEEEVVAPSTPPAAAAVEAEVPAEEAQEPQREMYTINFDKIQIIEYIRFVSKITGTNFLFDGAELQFTVTIVSEDPSPVKDIMSSLLQILRIHGFSLLEEGNNVLIYKNPDIPKLSEIVAEELGNLGTIDTPIITRVFKLLHTNPERVAEIIKPMVTNHALVEVSQETRHVIVTDLAANIAKIETLIKTLDSPTSALEIETFTARNTAVAA